MTEEDVLDGFYQLGREHTRAGELGGGVKGDMLACLRREKGGFERLFGEDHAKSADATFKLVFQTAQDDDERMAELRAL